jgi:hypothetical protein
MESPNTTQGEVLNLLNLIRPWHVMDRAKIRLGAPNDGGYVLPDLALESNLLVSIGIGDDITFDAEFARRGAQIYQFDHTIAAPPYEHPSMHFHRKGWGAVATDQLMSFDQIVDVVDWTNSRHPVLKFDVEGAEWAGLNAMSLEHLGRFEVVTAEFHNIEQIFYRPNFELVQGAFAKLSALHMPVHLHVNNYQGLTMVNGVPIPCVIELSYLRKDCGIFAGHSTEPIPGPLDRPNNIRAPDICLRPF